MRGGESVAGARVVSVGCHSGEGIAQLVRTLETQLLPQPVRTCIAKPAESQRGKIQFGYIGGLDFFPLPGEKKTFL